MKYKQELEYDSGVFVRHIAGLDTIAQFAELDIDARNQMS
jgi:hypothetical protein